MYSILPEHITHSIQFIAIDVRNAPLFKKQPLIFIYSTRKYFKKKYTVYTPTYYESVIKECSVIGKIETVLLYNSFITFNFDMCLPQSFKKYVISNKARIIKNKNRKISKVADLNYFQMYKGKCGINPHHLKHELRL